MDNELKFGDKYFNGMLKLSQVPNWNPLYEFLKHIFGDKYKDAADGFMFMGAYKYEEIDTDFYIYKHGITRKSFVLDKDGEPYELDYKLIKYYDPNKKSGHSIDNFIQGASKMSYSDMFNYIYQNIVKMVNQACEANDCKIPDDSFLMRYADYAIIREKLLKKLGIKSISVSNTDDFKNLKIESNKTRDRLYEMFDRVCGVKLINESNDSKIDFGLLVKGYIKEAMDLISIEVRIYDSFKQDEESGNTMNIEGDIDDEEYLMGSGKEFSLEVAFDNARKLVNDYNRVGLDRFISDYVDEDNLIDVYNYLKLIFDNIDNNIIIEMIKYGIDYLKLGAIILLLRNDNHSKGIDTIVSNAIKELNIGGVDFSVSDGKLIFVKDGEGKVV